MRAARVLAGFLIAGAIFFGGRFTASRSPSPECLSALRTATALAKANVDNVDTLVVAGQGWNNYVPFNAVFTSREYQRAATAERVVARGC